VSARRSALSWSFVLLAQAACSGTPSDPTAGAGGEGGTAGGAGGSPAGGMGGSAGGQGGQGGEDLSGVLYGKLDQSQWNAVLDRDGAFRAYELSFHTAGYEWAELRNPFGPGRQRAGGQFIVHPDGSTLQAVDDATGDVRTWTVTVQEGNPRKLLLDDGSAVEEFTEGPWPAPTGGLTAEVRVFQSNGAIADAYCKAGSFQCDIDYDVLFAFARGGGPESDLGSDAVAGSALLGWYNVPNFAVTDLDGFSPGDLGGTPLSDQFNFVVRYTGWVQHPGGLLEMREEDDDVGEFNPTDYGGVWAFVGGDVGVGGFDQLFLGVNAFGFCSDGSGDEPGTNQNAGLVPIEIIMIRCNTDGPPVDVQMALQGGAWTYVGNQPTVPDTTAFAPAF